MLVVDDALGHGAGAAEVSHKAVQRLSTLPLDIPVLEAMHAVHDALRGTRGAAATIFMLAGARVEACAVGNVHLLCASCEVPLVLSPGILGHQVSRFRVAQAELRSGARVALVSDGVSLRFRLEELRHLAPAEACNFIIQRHRRQEDDATVLIADLKG
jgi:negative regulator of sigma-B (phosphoserine phosphatase)